MTTDIMCSPLKFRVFMFWWWHPCQIYTW